MREESKFVPIMREIGILSIRYQAYIKGFEKLEEVIKQVKILKEMIDEQYTAPGCMFDNSTKRNETILNEDNISRSTDSDPGLWMGGFRQDNNT